MYTCRPVVSQSSHSGTSIELARAVLLASTSSLEKMGGVRGALFTNHTERGNAMVDGIAVEVASGLWPAIVKYKYKYKYKIYL